MIVAEIYLDTFVNYLTRSCVTSQYITFVYHRVKNLQVSFSKNHLF